MKFKNALLLIFTLFSFDANGNDFNILDFGAIRDTSKLSTLAINKTIEACFKAGGGRIIIPTGNFKSGTITLLNNVEIFLERGAVLYGSTDHRDYPRQQQPVYRSQKDPGGWYALIYAESASNIGISGFGTIDGQGARQVPRPGPKGAVHEDRDGRPRKYPVHILPENFGSGYNHAELRYLEPALSQLRKCDHQ